MMPEGTVKPYLTPHANNNNKTTTTTQHTHKTIATTTQVRLDPATGMPEGTVIPGSRVAFAAGQPSGLGAAALSAGYREGEGSDDFEGEGEEEGRGNLGLARKRGVRE